MSTNTEIDRSTGTGAPRTDGGTTVSNMVAAESPLHPDPPGHTSSLGAPANTTTSGDATKDAIRSFVTGSVNFQTPEIKTTGSSYTPYDPTGPSGPTTTPGIAQALLRTALQAQNKELSQQVQALIQRLKIRKEPANEASTPEEDFPSNKLTLTKAQVYKEIQQTVSEQEHFDGATAASGKGPVLLKYTVLGNKILYYTVRCINTVLNTVRYYTVFYYSCVLYPLSRLLISIHKLYPVS